MHQSCPDRQEHVVVDLTPETLTRVSVSSTIRTKDNGLTVLYRGARGMVRPSHTLHRDTWDTVLCEGVLVSLRELLLLTAERLGLPVSLESAHVLLRCSWSLGWHVHTKTSKGTGTTRHYWDM